MHLCITVLLYLIYKLVNILYIAVYYDGIDINQNTYGILSGEQKTAKTN